ncbi:Uncharacterized protein HZ326_27314 [Fusarium oxysporum f. sp. albedinis]|nr:Uncharacterized protein HZ326_27314 [Fusarium oxysporum f. sp. albedinis]
MAGPVPRRWRSAKVRFMAGQIWKESRRGRYTWRRSMLDSAFVNAQSSSSDITDDPDRPESTSTNTSAKLYVDLFGPCLQCCASALRGKLSVYGLQASQLSRRSLHLPSFSPKRLQRNSGANLWSLNLCAFRNLVYGLISALVMMWLGSPRIA